MASDNHQTVGCFWGRELAQVFVIFDSMICICMAGTECFALELWIILMKGKDQESKTGGACLVIGWLNVTLHYLTLHTFTSTTVEKYTFWDSCSIFCYFILPQHLGDRLSFSALFIFWLHVLVTSQSGFKIRPPPKKKKITKILGKLNMWSDNGPDWWLVDLHYIYM